jgi:hypothetical protein
MSYKNIVLIAISGLLLLGCATPRPPTMTPLQAGIPELHFWYWKADEWVLVRGHGGEHFEVGDPKKFRIKTQMYGGDCQIRYVDGNTDLSVGCKGKEFIDLDLGAYYENHPEVIGISVTFENIGSQFGHFYPSLREKRDVLDVTFVCPWQEDKEGLAICTRPATYNFNFTVHFDENDKGQFYYGYQCRGKEPVERIENVQGPSKLELSLNSSKPDYCVIGLGFRKGLTSGVKSHVIHVRFYDPAYVPLSLPEIKPTSDTTFNVCAGAKFEATNVGGKDYRRQSSGTCKPYTISQNYFEAWAWDTVGRFSWGYHSTQPVLVHNGFSFYDEIEPWVVSKIQETCRPVTERCLKRNQKKFFSDPKLVKAVETWDASYVYN